MALVNTDVADFNQLSRQFWLRNQNVPSDQAPNEFGLSADRPNAQNTTVVVTYIRVFTGLLGGASFQTRIFAEEYTTPPTSISGQNGLPLYFDNLILDPNSFNPQISNARYGDQVGGVANIRQELGAVTLTDNQEFVFAFTPVSFTFNLTRSENWLMRFEVDVGGQVGTFFDMKWYEF